MNKKLLPILLIPILLITTMGCYNAENIKGFVEGHGSNGDYYWINLKDYDGRVREVRFYGAMVPHYENISIGDFMRLDVIWNEDGHYVGHGIVEHITSEEEIDSLHENYNQKQESQRMTGYIAFWSAIIFIGGGYVYLKLFDKKIKPWYVARVKKKAGGR